MGYPYHMWVGLLLTIFAHKSYGQNNTFDFSCLRASGLCNTGTCNVATQACVCPADGGDYNYECLQSTDGGYCSSPYEYGPDCENGAPLPRVQVYCAPGKMFVNIFPHGGVAKFGGLMYINGKTGVAACEFQTGTTQVYESKEVEYGFVQPDDMQGFYLELDNTNADCGDVVTTTVEAQGDEAGYTSYTREYRVQYNPAYSASWDQVLTAVCKQTEGETKVYVGIGEVVNDDNSGVNKVDVESEVGMVSLELLDTNFVAIAGPIPLGTEIILKFTLGASNEYTDLWISGCSANNTLDSTDANFKSIELVSDTGCPSDGSVGVFKSFPNKPTVAAGQPKVVLMSIGAFRFTGTSSKVAFQCNIKLCKAGDTSGCEKQICDGYSSPELEIPVTDTDGTDTTALAATLAADQANPLDLAEAVILTCAAVGGTGPYQYSIHLTGGAVTFGAETTLSVPAAVAAGTVGYVCVVKDAGDAEATSAEVSLERVDTYTARLTQSPEGDAKINTNVELTCKAAGGAGSYTYTLLKDGADSGATTFPFTVTSATVVSNTYKCQATDTGNGNAQVDSNDITLKFVADDTDTTTPVALAATLAADKANPLGLSEAVTLTCTAAGGNGPYQYSIHETGGTATFGAETTLTVPAAVAAGTVGYVCVVKDADAAEATSAEVSLERVDAYAVKLTQSPEGDAKINTDVELTCKAAGGTGPYTYTLLKDDADSGATTFPFTVTSATVASNTYKCQVKDTGNADAPLDSNEITLNFINPLAVSLASDVQNPVAENTNAIITYTATGGTGPYTAAWLVDAVAVDGETGTSYTVTYQAGATVKVTVEVTDAASTKVSTDYTVTFAGSTTTVEAPTATLTADQLNPLGLTDPVILTCAAQGGTAPYEYSIHVAGETATYGQETTLSLPTAAEAGTVSYVCDVKDSAETTGASNTVSVERVAALTSRLIQSPEGDAKINTNVELTCKAAGGTGPYTYTLLKDNADSGATEFPFTVTSATVASNVYKCQTTDTGNENVQLQSNEITLNFIDPLAVSLASDVQNPVAENTNSIITYTATGGTAPYTATWLVDDVAVDGETGTSYTVTYQAGATVKVTVEVTDAASTIVTTDYTVTFAGAAQPALSATLATTSLNPLGLAEAITLTCTAQGGTAPYTYSITKEGDPATFAEENTLAVPNADAAGTVSYVCTAKDATGAEIASQAVALTYVDTFSAQAYADPSGPVLVNTQVTLTCKAAGSANELTYAWKINEVDAPSTTSTLTDTSATAATNSYKCTVTDATVPTSVEAGAVSVEFTAARKRRSAILVERQKRATPDSDTVSGVVSVFDPEVGQTDTRVTEETKSTECSDNSDVVVVVVVLSVAVVLLLILSTILGMMLMRSRQKVGGLSQPGHGMEYPVQTMTMPRLEINSGYGSGFASHGV